MELGATDGEPSADHIVFRWAGNLGSSRGAGIAAVAQSGNERAARELADRLGPVLRVRGRGARPSLVRMKDGSQVVLLSRMPGVDANSRDSTVCHAIVGSSSLLRAKFCLALGAATPWQPSDWLETVKGKVDPLSQQTLRRTAAEWEPRLRRAVPLVARPLECLVAQFLRAPEGRVSALHGELVEAVAAAGASAPAPEGHPVGSALDPALVALWGLCDIFNSSLGQGGWSYATYDSLDSHHRVVFVPAWKGSPEEDARLQRIDLGDPGSDDHADRAHEMVADYCRWAVSGAGGPYPRYHGVSAPARVPPVDRSAASPYSPQQFSGPADMDARRDQEQARRQRVQEQNRYEDSGRRSPQESFTGRDGFERDGSEPYERDQARGTGPFSLYGQESEQGSRPVPEPERSRQSERAWGPPPAPPRRSGPRDAGRQQPSTAAPAGGGRTDPTWPVIEWVATEAPQSQQSPQSRIPEATVDTKARDVPPPDAFEEYGAAPGDEERDDNLMVVADSLWEPRGPSAGPPPVAPPVPPRPNVPPRVPASELGSPGAFDGADTRGHTASLPVQDADMDTDRFAWSELDRTVQRRLQELPGLPESPQFKKKGRRSPKAEPRSAGLDALITDLHSAARPGAHQPPELRRNVEDRLRFLPDTDLVEILRRPLSIEAQHLVLVMLPEPARPHDEGVKLCNALLSARLLLTSIAVPTRNETVRSLHIERAVTVACWLFHWLVQPLALDCDEALKKFLNDVASSQAAVDRHLVSELFIDSPLPRTPHLSDHVWQTLARGLSQREAAWVDEGRRHDPRLR